MTYRDHLVAVIKANGRILSEVDSTFTIPFGSEYSVLLKNLNSVRIQVAVSIDGVNVTEGTRLIIQPNADLELERFIKNGNLQAGNRFKFIERTGAIEAHRGIQVDDGLVRVEAWTEYIQPMLTVPIVHYYNPALWENRQPVFRSFQTTTTSSAPVANATYQMSCFAGQALHDASLNNDAGLTVPGSESNQQFAPTSGFALESQSRVIVLKLRGQVAGRKVVKAVTVKCKPQCVTCGKKNDPRSRFCAQCGTALTIL